MQSLEHWSMAGFELKPSKLLDIIQIEARDPEFRVLLESHFDNSP